MLIIKFDLLFLLTIFHVTQCERRIVDGDQVTAETPYVVYLVKAEQSDKIYDSWLCGGALVSKSFIITSAACVEDVHFMYAIAGYRKYVDDKHIDKNDCTKQMRKKIIYRCIPVSYEFDYNKIEKWAYIDMALVKVESPYNFDDARYQIICSYVPRIIPVNYDLKRQATNMDAMVLGWGHTEYWRQHGDTVNYNQENLRYGTTVLYDKKKCEQEYKDYPDLTKIIEKYMICSLEPGHVNDHGVPFSLKPKNTVMLAGGCITQNQKLMGSEGVLCEGESLPEHPEKDLINQLMFTGDNTRKHMSLNETNNNETKHIDNGTDIDDTTDIVNETDIVKLTKVSNRSDSVYKTDFIYKPGYGNISGFFNRTFSRRNGICQNDHGGPLVTWVGKREVLIGVASVFKITAENKCIGPFLYTSTVCNGAFIGCILNDKKAKSLKAHNESVSTRKALLCDSLPSVKGFDTIESYVSWKDHPDGPADNEKGMLRDILKPNKMKDRYATNVKRDSEEEIANLLNDRNSQQGLFPKLTTKKEEEESNDRFSLNIGLQPGMRPPPRKRPRLRKRRPPINRSPPGREPPPQMKPLPSIRSQPVMKIPSLMEHPPMVRPPTDIEQFSTKRPLPEMMHLSIRRPPPVMGPPPRVPQEMKPSLMIRPRPVMGPRPMIRPRPRPLIRLPPIVRPPPKMERPPIIPTPPKMKPPEFDEMQDFKSEVDFMKDLFNKKPFSRANQPTISHQ